MGLVPSTAAVSPLVIGKREGAVKLPSQCLGALGEERHQCRRAGRLRQPHRAPGMLLSLTEMLPLLSDELAGGRKGSVTWAPHSCLQANLLSRSLDPRQVVLPKTEEPS